MPIRTYYKIYNSRQAAPEYTTSDQRLAYAKYMDRLHNGGDIYRMEQIPTPEGALTQEEIYLLLVYKVRKLWKKYFNGGRKYEDLQASIVEENKLDKWHKKISSMSQNNSEPLPVKNREAFDFYLLVREWRDTWKKRKAYSKQKDFDEEGLKDISSRCRELEKQIDKYIKTKLQLI